MIHLIIKNNNNNDTGNLVTLSAESLTLVTRLLQITLCGNVSSATFSYRFAKNHSPLATIAQPKVVRQSWSSVLNVKVVLVPRHSHPTLLQWLIKKNRTTNYDSDRQKDVNVLNI